MEHRPLNPNHITHMTTHPHLRPITPEQITEIKKSRQHASEFFKRLRITGWPKVVTLVLGLVMIFLYLLAAAGWYWNKSKKEEQSPPAPYEQRR